MNERIKNNQSDKYSFVQVLWQKEGREVLSLRQKVYSGDRRHRVLHGRQEEWNLQISSVSAEDYGLYTCVVNTAPPLTRTVYLQREDDLGTGEGEEERKARTTNI